MGNNLEKARLLFNDICPDDMSHLPEISQYNCNYYTINNCLLYGESDDDNFTAWYWVLGDRVRPIGGSYTSDGDKIIIDEAYT